MVKDQLHSPKKGLGFTFRVPYFDGKELLVSSTKGEIVTHGKVMTLKGKGLPFFKDTLSAGNLNINFSVRMPLAKQLTESIKLGLKKVRNQGADSL